MPIWLCHGACHIFVHCPAFQTFRPQDLHDEYSQSLVSDMAHSLCGNSTLDSLHSHITHVVTHLFRDNDSWPLGSSLFYLGLLPPLLPTTCPYSSLSTDAHRLLTRVAIPPSDLLHTFRAWSFGDLLCPPLPHLGVWTLVRAVLTFLCLSISNVLYFCSFLLFALHLCFAFPHFPLEPPGIVRSFAVYSTLHYFTFLFIFLLVLHDVVPTR